MIRIVSHVLETMEQHMSSLCNFFLIEFIYSGQEQSKGDEKKGVKPLPQNSKSK